MKKLIVAIGLIICACCFSGNTVQAQIVDGAFQRVDISKKKPMQFPYVREADVMWSKKIWRIIDLREKMNQVLYFPTVETEGRNSLTNLMLKAIEDGLLTAYDARTDDEFKIPLTYDQVKEAFGATTRTRRVRNLETGEFEDRVIAGEIRGEEIKQIMVKEEWFFDKQTSTMNVRIIGLCPIQEYYRDEDINRENVQRRQVFWIYYPEARELLASNAIMNTHNTAYNMSFDDLFIKRRFNSYVVKESNVYNNRAISQYLTGRNAMLESKQIEQKIFNYEQDLWEY
ncbi:type IX secretion system ring subunit PorN/GldN [Mangrovibacterium lignilyticum]|uniref:type IX secretion system ring protein PorN/GldN n=1 Tax=Mangrovibacterium lignilyticum TaxID=2668052 RepID=UPI0013D1655C|nr:gliding motility protein GldN [Mangrovibacterium lignilyticum]